MGVFDNHITNQDDIILQHFNFKVSSDYKKTMVLEEKFDPNKYLSSYCRRVFIPTDIVWKYYCSDGGLDAVDKLYGGHYRPTKNEFTAFVSTFIDSRINKLIFRGQTYIDRSVLHPIFDAFNVYFVEEQIRKRYNNEY